MPDYLRLSNMADSLNDFGMRRIPWIDWVGSIGIRLGFRLLPS